MMEIGAHVHAADPLAEAAECGAGAVQFFLGNPQSWKKPPPRSDAAQLREATIPLYVHANYLINVASPNNRIRIPSRTNLAHAAEAAAAIGAAGLIVHGGHVGDDEEVAVGFERWRKALETVEADVRILIENTAGGGNAVVRELENYGPLWEEISEFNVGACLDTCHAWASGADLTDAVDVVRAATGGPHLVHCNDSRDPLGSSRDRHANLGDGEIPPDLLVGVVRGVRRAGDRRNARWRRRTRRRHRLAPGAPRGLRCRPETGKGRRRGGRRSGRVHRLDRPGGGTRTVPCHRHPLVRRHRGGYRLRWDERGSQRTGRLPAWRPVLRYGERSAATRFRPS